MIRLYLLLADANKVPKKMFYRNSTEDCIGGIYSIQEQVIINTYSISNNTHIHLSTFSEASLTPTATECGYF